MSKYYYVVFYNSEKNRIESVKVASLAAIRERINSNDKANEVISQVKKSADNIAKEIYEINLSLHNKGLEFPSIENKKCFYTTEGYDLAKEDIKDLSDLITDVLNDYYFICHEYKFATQEIEELGENLIAVSTDYFDAVKEKMLISKYLEWRKLNELTDKLNELSENRDIQNKTNLGNYSNVVSTVSHVIKEFDNNYIFNENDYPRCSNSFEELAKNWCGFSNSFDQSEPDVGKLKNAANACNELRTSAKLCIEQSGYILDL